jgi:hypothetical protein
VNSPATVIGALRRFLPEYLKTKPPLSTPQRRAIWAITHCRTAALGGRAFECERCRQIHFAFHSCNHKACPQCGREATRRWVQRELGKRVNAPYFLVTFTLPAELRACFFGPLAKQAYDLFLAAASAALSEKLATDKGLRAEVNGFTAVLHTWNQRLEFHPHIHCLVPGAGLDATGRPVRVRQPEFLLYVPHLQAAFRQHMRRLLQHHAWQVDPKVWTLDWGVQIQPVGSGVAAVKYLGAYVARTAIADSRILDVNDDSVTFRWKDRSDHDRIKPMTLPGIEFVKRYLRHVLPTGLRSVRYYGFCHPAAKAKRLCVQFLTGMIVQFGAADPGERPNPTPDSNPSCPFCGGATHLLLSIPPPYRKRGPSVRPEPIHPRSQPISMAA